jgi:SAM-dependent methyltransferase
MRSIIPFVRPEVAAGAILRDDGEIHFYTRINALLRPEMVVIDYGAGRGGVFLSGEYAFREKLANLQGKVQKVIGIDVDDGVLAHPYLDERHVIEVGAPIPVEDQSTDLVIAHWVFEHIEDPSRLADEFFRILKPGGWICARTPHRWSYVGIASSLIPDGLQRTLLRWLKPRMEAQDKFKTAYRLNSRRAIGRFFDSSKWQDYSYGFNSTPRYHFENRFVFSLLSAIQAVAWPKVDLVVLIRKK